MSPLSVAWASYYIKEAEFAAISVAALSIYHWIRTLKKKKKEVCALVTV